MSQAPDDESQRVAALRRYQILDTLPEPQFDDIAELARTLFEAPIALISLVDERRQWFKAHPGLPRQEMSREEALCARTIRGFDVFVVDDACQDERFRDSPLVAAEPHIRFYAGVPLCTPDGFNLGALCVMDTRPRHDVTTRQIEMLSGLARIVVREIEIRPLAEITHRVEQESRLLLRATTHYRTILEGGNEGIWALDAEARTTYANARMADMLGYQVEEMLGRPNFDFMDAAAREQHERRWAECRSGAPSRYELRFLDRNGADLWVLVSLAPIHDDEGRFTGALAMCSDISDRKKLERRLAEREAAFQSLTKHSPSPMWVYDYETLKFLKVNEAAIAHYGYSHAEFLSMQVTDVRLIEQVTPLIAGPSTGRNGLRPGERRHRTKDRGFIVVETSSSTIQMSGRDAVLEVIHDITGRKQAEDALRASEALLKGAQQRAKLAYWTWDPATESYTFGDAYIEVIGVESIDDVRTDEQFLRFVHEDDLDRVAAAVERGRDRLERQDIEYRVRRADGRIVWLREICEPELDAAGQPRRLFGVVQDITDQKRAMEALRESETRLRHAGRMAKFGHWLWTADVPGGWADGRSEYSAEAAAILGRDPADLTMGTLEYYERIMHPDDAERLRSIGERVSSDPSYSMEYRIVRPDGEIRHVLEFAENTFDDAGRIVSTTGTIQDVTELKRMEERLRESEARLRAFMDHAPVAMFEKDLHGRFTIFNRHEAAFFGRQPEEIIGRRSADLLASDDAALVEAHDRSVLAGGAPVERELHFANRPRLEWSYEVKFPIMDAAGKVVALGGVAVDISALKRTEQALRDSEARMRAFMDHAPMLIYLKDIDGRYQLVNREFEQVEGTREDQLRGKTVFDVLPPEHAAPFTASDREVLTLGRMVVRENHDPVRTLYRDSLAVKFPVRDSHGAIVGLGGFTQDITERKRAENALRESEARLRHAGRMAKFGEWLWTADVPGGWEDGRSDYSAEGAAILGRDPAEVDLGTVDYCARIVHPDDGERVRVFCERMHERGDPTYSVEYRIVRPNGEVRDVLEFAENTYDDLGRLVSTAGTIQDITELKRMEEQLRQAQKTETIVRITGGIAHDFNNLFAIIGGTAELLGEQLKGNRSQREQADTIVAAVGRGADLVGQLLSFARRQPLVPKRVDVNGLISGLRRRIRHKVGEGVEVDVGAATGLWPALVDPTQLQAALINLAANARDAMPFGGRIRIETANVDLDQSFVAQNRGARPGTCVMVAVVDSGTGMTPEVAARAFEPFFTTKGFGRGSGLGLSMVYGFVKQSGGHVQVETRVGKGTSIRLYLPRAEDEGTRAAALPTGSETILVVEDDDLARVSVESLLDALGYAVVAVAGPETALDVLRSYTAIDLLFTDIDLPGEMNGLALSTAAVALRPGLPVLLTTGSADAGHGEGTEGEVDVLYKPYQHAELASRVRALLDRHVAT